MGALITIGQFLLSFSIIVILHECGHFFTARWFKTRVEKFYLFFNPFFSLFKFKKGETEYGIGWLPLGGYVKIAGMVDESFDMESLDRPPQPYEFRSKPAWQRLIIMIGGVVVNAILGMVLMTMILMVWGKEFIPNEKVEYGIVVSSLGREMGLKDGDMVTKVGSSTLKYFNDGEIRKELIISEKHTLTVDREGKSTILAIQDSTIAKLSKYEYSSIPLFYLRNPVVLESVSSENAIRAGLQKGDRVVGIDGKNTPYYREFYKELNTKTNQNVNLLVIRNKDTIAINILVNEDGKLGVVLESYGLNISNTKKYNFASAIVEGPKEVMDFLFLQLQAFGQMFKGKIKVKDSLGSFISIGKLFGDTWDWERFWKLTAYLSVLLGFLNLLPIPGLDGGYVMFLMYEIISGKKPSDRLLENATRVGFLLLIALMIYAIKLDIFRHFGN